MTLHPRDDLAAFALGALDPEEARAVRAHLDGCATCRAEASAFAEAAWSLARTAEREVPARLRGMIVERARAARAAAGRGSRLATVLGALPRPVPLAVPLTLALVLALALSGYVGARRDADRYASVIASIAGARVVALAPTGEVPGVRGSLVIPVTGAAYLVLDLPAAPSGKTWEAWILRGQTAVAAGITNDRGVTTLVLTAPLAGGDGVAVTLEPSGGRDQPTGAVVLAGKT